MRPTSLGGGAAAILFLCGALWPAAAEDVAPLSFTAAQATHGRVLFQENCAGCHGVTLQGSPGGPPLVGAAFRGRWQPQAGDALFAFVRSRMPPASPGSLGDAAYADILAYVLEGNGAVPGTVALAADPAQLAPLSLAKALPPLPAGAYGFPKLSAVTIPPDAITLAASKHRAERLQIQPVTDEMLQHPPEGDWINWRNTYDAHGFSPLHEIDRGNAGRLVVAWSWELPPGSNEITPLVHQGVMFVASGDSVEALDAATGDRLWRYDSVPTPNQPIGPVRNIAIYGDRLYLPAKQKMVALDMRSGAVVWEHTVASAADPIGFSGGPLIAKGKIIQGMSGCVAPYPGGCYVLALDPETGAEAWRFNTIARPGQPGGDSWNGAPVDQRYGGSVWNAGSYDPALDLLFIGTGQTYKAATLLQNGSGGPGSADALYTDSTLALRPETGELVWYFQHMGQDVWDLDWAFERTLATLTIDGAPRRTLTTAGKLGIFDTLDAATGRYLFSVDVGLQTLVEAIDPLTGAKKVGAAFKPVPDADQTICPSAYGGRDWPATAFNPTSGILFVPLNEACMPYRWFPGGSLDIYGLPMPRPGGDGMIGRVQAIDLAAHKTLWTMRRRAPQSSAILATAGGIVFEGSHDRWFRASDDRTGRTLWQIRLNGAPSAFPITYSVDGVQYVAVSAGAGSHDFLESRMGTLTPEIATPSSGTTLWVFRLPSP